MCSPVGLLTVYTADSHSWLKNRVQAAGTAIVFRGSQYGNLFLTFRFYGQCKLFATCHILDEDCVILF
ncbi:hypothetical protein RRG08_006885 [Elysia crispata]|uniref:Uncharacterized protein n=1 Tax=Elysia crispata TaxID=231223 RepID=A0AAE1A0Q7_9GAST|nr:hypothetical protein RRG08_006885 [Elysia crispata]